MEHPDDVLDALRCGPEQDPIQIAILSDLEVLVVDLDLREFGSPVALPYDRHLLCFLGGRTLIVIFNVTKAKFSVSTYLSFLIQSYLC